MFQFKRDYKDWIVLRHESPDNIGILEDEWNDFDHLTARTKMLHNTKRKTQPWKTGLPVDFTPADKLRKYPALAKLNRRPVGAVQGPPGPETGTVLFRPGARVPGKRHCQRIAGSR